MTQLTQAGLYALLKEAGHVLAPNGAVKLAVDPDWDPKDHPKDALGKFVKKGHGVFLFGKTKTAKFTHPLSYDALPPDKFEDTLTVTAEPGESVYHVVGTPTIGMKEPKHYLVKVHATGSMSSMTLHPSGHVSHKQHLDPSVPIAKAIKGEGHLKASLLVQSPATTVTADSEEQAKEKLNSAVGKVVYHSIAGPVVLEKDQQVWKTSAISEVLTTGGVPDVLLTPSGPEDLPGEEQAGAAKLVAKQGTLVADGAAPHVTADLSEQQDPTFYAQSSGAVMKANLEDWPVGTKVSFDTENHGEQVATKTSPKEWTYADATFSPPASSASVASHLVLYPEGGGFYVELPDQHPTQTETKHPTAPGGDTFTHPVSGEQMTDVAAIFQHKKSPNSFLVQSASGTWTFFDKSGKAKPASTKTHLPYLNTNYSQVSGAQVPTSGVAPTGGVSKKAPLPSLPKEWTSPDGEKYDLLPGWKVLANGEAFVLVEAKGPTAYWPPNGKKVILHGGKTSHYKAWTTVAENKATPLPAPDLSDAKPLAKFEHGGATFEVPKLDDSSQYLLADHLHGELAKSLKTKSGWSYPATLEGSPFDSPDPSTLAAHLASPAFEELAKTAVVTLDQAQNHSKVTKKAYLGKEKSRWTFLAQISEFARKLQDPEYPAADLENDSSQIQSKLSHHNVTFGSDFLIPKSLGSKLQQAFDSKKFKETLTGLGFDPDTADTSTLTNYATNKGFPYAGGLDHDEAKLWVKVDLNDPTALDVAHAMFPGNYFLSNVSDVKDLLKANAQFKVTAANTATYLKSIQAKLSAQELSKQEKALKAKQAAVLKQVASMSTSYSSGSSTMTKTADDEWTKSDGEVLTTAQAFDLIQGGHWTPNGKTPKQALDAVGAALGADLSASTTYGVGLDGAAANFYIKEHGGSYVGKMDFTTKMRWIRADVLGDHALKYYLEHEAAGKGASAVLHKDHATNPGSWGSPEGTAYRSTLADFIEAQPWGPTLLDDGAAGLTMVDMEQAASVLPLRAHAETFAAAGWDSAALPLRRAILSDWVKTRGPLPKASYSAADLQLKADDPDNPPAGVSKEAWALILGAEHGAPDVKALTEASEPSGPWGLGVNPLLVSYVPTAVQKLAEWAKASNAADSAAAKKTKTQVLAALTERVNQGQYTPGDAVLWSAPDGTKVPIAPGTAIWKDAYGVIYVVSPDKKTITRLKAGTGITTVAVSNLPSIESSMTKVFQSPLHATWGQAEKDGLQAEKFTWDAVQSYEDGETKLPSEWASKNEPTLLYTVKNSPGVPSVLVDNVDKLPHQALVLAAWAASVPDKATLNVLAYKLKSGHYAQLQIKPLVDPHTSYGAQVLKGFVTPDEIFSQWPSSAKVDFAHDFGLPPQKSASLDASAIALKIKELFSDEPDIESLSTAAPTSLPTDLKLTPLSKSLGGMHSKQAYTDQAGNEWMSKAFSSDPNAKARIDAEHEANVIGRLFGFRNPETRVMNLKGVYSYVQHLAPATGSLSGVAPQDLNDEQLAQAMEEHVLDWLVSNHDSHPENLLKAPNGKSIIGIDKGQAFKFFPKDKLAVGYLPPGNGAAVWYDQFYHAAQSGQIDKKRLDFVAKRVIGKALKIAESKDEEYRAHLENALKNRHNFPAQYPTAKAMVDALVERKHAVAKDFYDLYAKQVYGQAHAMDFTLEDLTPKQLFPDLHVSVSQDLMDDVKKGAVHGKALMFDSQDLEDAHVLLYTEQDVHGNTILAGDAKVRANADKVVEAWLSAQSVADEVGTSSLGSTSYPVGPQHELLPGNETWYSKIVTSAKTVNHHQADGEYNASSLAATDELKAYLSGQLLSLKLWETAHPDEPYTVPASIGQGVTKFTFVTQEQQAAWKAAVEKYIADVDTINQQKDAKAKIKPPINMAVYKASKGLDTTHFVPGTPDEPSEEPPTSDEQSSIVELEPGKQIKVSKKKAYGTSGSLDQDKGVLTANGMDQHDGHTGYQYDIEYDGVKIMYRPWGSGAAKSQQGYLKFTVEGDDALSPAKLEDVFDTMRDMGLEMNPADETSLRKHYWKHLYGVAMDRAADAKTKQTIKAIQDAYAKNPNMSNEEELAVLEEAWALSIGKDKVAAADWSPHFDRTRPQDKDATYGHPYWYRPDFTLAELKKSYGKNVPISSITGKSQMDVAMSGLMAATDDRLRLLGQYVTGMSSGADQGHGSAGFVFTRQNYPHGNQVYFHPKTVLRTSNYAFSSDHYGEIDARKGVSFHPSGWVGYSGGSNELMIKHHVGVMGGIAAMIMPSGQRTSVLAHYKKYGVTEIDGIPIEEIFVTSTAEAEKTVAKVWQRALEEEGKLAGLTASQKAAYAAYIGQGLGPDQALQEAMSS